MSVEERMITSNEPKAYTFVGHCFCVSLLPSTHIPRIPGRYKQNLVADVPDFTIAELKQGISKLQCRGVPGPDRDNIPPLFRKNLGPKAMEIGDATRCACGPLTLLKIEKKTPSLSPY